MFSHNSSVETYCRIFGFIVLCLGSGIFAQAFDGGIPPTNSSSPIATLQHSHTAFQEQFPPQNSSNNTSEAVHSKAPHISTPKNISLSEATDMTSSQKYTGGSDVDEIRPTPPSNRVHKNHTRHFPSTLPMHAEITAVEDNGLFEDLSHPTRQKLKTDKFNPTFAAIVAAICITTAVGGYVLLMAWRKVEMDRYGNRQMLVNEDDFGDIQDEDMRHFEASCIQIDG